MKALKHFALIIAAATLLLSCDKQEEPMGGGTGTVTPVNDSTNQIEPASLRITYVRTDSLQYSFFCFCSLPFFSYYEWTLEDPGLETPFYDSHTDHSEIHYTFHAPGKAKLTVSITEFDMGAFRLDTLATTSMTINVH